MGRSGSFVDSALLNTLVSKYLVLLCGCTYASLSIASAYNVSKETTNHLIELAPVLSFASFREFEAGAKLVQETGVLYGVCLSYRRKIEKLNLSAGGCRRESDIDYSGRTQQGRPFITRSDIEDSGFELRGHYSFFQRKMLSASAGIELGYQEWARDIRGRGSVAGLEEKYDWRFYGVSTSLGYQIARDWDFTLSFRYSRTDAARAKIKFPASPFIDVARLSLANAWTEAADAKLQYRVDDSLRLAVTMAYESWDLGPSLDIPLTSGGVALTQTVRQPMFKISLLSYAFTLAREFQ